jgi:hypothetical protein
VSSADNNEKKENAPNDTISLFCLLLAPISGESADVIQVAVKPQPPSFFFPNQIGCDIDADSFK